MSKLNLIHGDCMEYMKDMEDNQFDLAIVDPPYGIKRLSVQENRSPDSKYRKSLAKIVDSTKSWNHKKMSGLFFRVLQRVSKYQIVWGANNFNLPESEYFIVWDKQQTVDNFASAELAWTNMPKPAKVFRYSIHKHNSSKGETIHPTQKPVAFYKWLLKNYAKEGDTILDTHLGSMSIAIACHDTGFDLTGYEINEDYYKAGMKRVNNHIAQGRLFEPEKKEEVMQSKIEFKHK